MRTLLACIVILLAVPARADDVESVARKHFESGQQLSARGLYLEALAEFSAGFELSGKPLFLFNMAECARYAGQKDRARQLYRRYLDADAKGKLAPVARTRLEELGPPPEPAPPPPLPARPPPLPARPAPPPPMVTTPSPVLVEAKPVPVDQPARPPLWKKKGLWIGVSVGAAAIIVAGALGGYYGSRAADNCSTGCVNFR